MRLKRWIEGRISGRKSRAKDGSTTSADDQFVYHPSPFRHQLSHIATPSHNPPPKLHHQLEQRLNEQLKERLSGHFTSSQINGCVVRNNVTNQGELSNVHLRRTASALDSRSKARKLFNRASEYNAVEPPPAQYRQYDRLGVNSQLLYGVETQPHHQYTDPYSLPNELNPFENGALTSSYPVAGLTTYEPPYQNDYLTDFENEMHRREQTNYQPNGQNRYSSITQASNESAFFDCSSPSLATDGIGSPSLGKQRSRIKTNPWLPSPWMSSNSMTNSLNSNGSRSNQADSRSVRPADSTSSSLEPKHNVQRASYNYNENNYNDNSFNENYLSKNAALNGPAASVRTSFSFASTVSSDSGCNVNTSSMDASVISANNFNESLMSCSIMTNNSLFANEELVDDDEEQILTISHNNGGQQIVNQMNVKHYIEQLNASQSSQNSQPLISTTQISNNQTALQHSAGNGDSLPLSSTCEDFGEISSRAESQLSAIYQQIDELKSKIDEIDHDNGRIKAKMNSLVGCGNSKVSLGAKKNASFTVRPRENQESYPYDHRSAFANSFLPPSSAAKAVPNNAAYTNSSEESGSSPTYSPASTSPSLASSPIQNSSSTFAMNDQVNDSLLNNSQQSNKSLQHPAMTSSASFNSSNCTTTPSSCWSLASICSGQNVPASSALATNMSIIEEYKVTNGLEGDLEKVHHGSSKTSDGQQTTAIDSRKSNNEDQFERVFSYLKQNDPSRLHSAQLNCQDQLQKLLSNGRRRKSFGTGKFANARRSLDEYSKFGRATLGNSNAINRLSNESWVSTATDDLLASSDEEEQTLNYVNNQLKAKKSESRLARPGMLSESRPVPSNLARDLVSANLKSDKQSAESPRLARPMLLPNYGDHNSRKDAFVSNNQESIERKQPPRTGHRSQIPKPLTPIKTNDNYKRLKPINGSRIPIMRPIIENEFDLLSSPPSPAPIDRHVNRVDYRPHQIDLQTNHRLGTPVAQRLESTPVQSRCLPKPKPFTFKKFDYPDSSCLVSPLTQQLKFEKEQRKLNYSFKKSYPPTDLLTSPPLSSDSGCQSDNSPLAEQQSKHQTLAYQIQNLRLELRDVSCAINDAKKDDYYGHIAARL